MENIQSGLRQRSAKQLRQLQGKPSASWRGWMCLEISCKGFPSLRGHSKTSVSRHCILSSAVTVILLYSTILLKYYLLYLFTVCVPSRPRVQLCSNLNHFSNVSLWASKSPSRWRASFLLERIYCKTVSLRYFQNIGNSGSGTEWWAHHPALSKQPPLAFGGDATIRSDLLSVWFYGN